MDDSVSGRTEFLSALKAELAAAEWALKEKQRRVDLLRKVVDAYENQMSTRIQPQVTAPRKRETHLGSRPDSQAHGIIKCLVSLLEERKEPIHIRILMEHLESRGIKVGGAHPRRTLSVLLSGSHLFKSHGHHGWTLAR